MLNEAERGYLDRMVRSARPRLVDQAVRLAGNADEAEDLVQEALTRALLKLARYPAIRRFGPGCAW